MEPLGTQELRRVLDIMYKMQTAVTDADWQALTLLDNERRAIIQFDPTGIPVSKKDSAALQLDKNESFADTQKQSSDFSDTERQTLVLKIQELDAYIIATAQASRQSSINESRELSNQQKVKNLYAKTNSMS